MSDAPSPAVLVIGASRGLGLALAKEWLARGRRVIATVRGAATPLHALAGESGERLRIEQLDVTDAAAVARLAETLTGQELDVLFVNAGVALGPDDEVGRVSEAEFTRIMLTNALGPMRLIEALGPRVRKGGAIAAMSSGLGSVSLNESGGWEVYRASKAALNTLMRSYAARHRGDGRALALVDPGWVKTDMGGADAALDVSQSIPGVVDALEARKGKDGLSFFNYQGKTVAW